MGSVPVGMIFLAVLSDNAIGVVVAIVGAGWQRGSDGVRVKGERRMQVVFQAEVNLIRQRMQAIVKQADVATRDIPVIVLSIVDQQDLGYRLGAFDYLVKPFDRDAILATLARLAPPLSRLLVVDDDPHVGELVRQLLDGEPYAIETVADGQEALQAVTRQPPDVMLLDLLMPRLDGFSVLAQLQQEPRYRALPVIVLTAKILTTEEQTLLQQHVRTVLQKGGLERDVLLHEVRSALQAYQHPAGGDYGRAL